MKRIALIGCLGLLLMGCQSKKELEMELLSGYWEIDRVEWSDRRQKSYGVNSVVDYFHLDSNGNEGYRKKVQPQLSGGFITSDDAVSFRVERLEKGRVYLNFYSGDANWSEEIVELDSVQLVLAGSEGAEYHYRRFTPFAELPSKADR
jgi:hypothetical protein